MSPRKVIVFGPTGAVGASAATTAAELGAHVTLAMRDASKPIRGLSASEEKSGDYTRVTADLEKPDTVRDAVAASGAKHAFIYLMFHAQDHMRATVEALKAGGVEQVVFLSSFTVQGDLKSIEPSQFIPYKHMKVEGVLEEVFGAEGFVAVRPGSFASNTFQYKSSINKGRVNVVYPDVKVDGIVPQDIGRVCGTVLARGPPQDGNRGIYLYGPEMLTQKRTVEIIAEVLGKSPKIETTSDPEESLRVLVEEYGLPETIGKTFVEQHQKSTGGGDDDVFGYKIFPEDRDNVQKYSGERATTFAEWVDQNKDLFEA